LEGETTWSTAVEAARRAASGRMQAGGDTSTASELLFAVFVSASDVDLSEVKNKSALRIRRVD
jgi:hypothetical protein